MPDRWLGPLPKISSYFSSGMHATGDPDPDDPEDRAAIFTRYSPDEARALIAELRRQQPPWYYAARPRRLPRSHYGCTTFYRFPVTDPQIAPA